MGIDVLPPDVNASERDFAVREGKIRFGLSAVKNVGDNAVRAIVQARDEGGPFHSIWDFCERVDWQHVTARVLESLVKAGALDSTGDPRKGMLRVLDQAVGLGRKVQADRNAGQGEPVRGPDGRRRGGRRRAAHSPVPAGEMGRRELLAFERETLGLYLSSHPLADVRAEAAPAHRLRARRPGRPPRRRDGDHRRADRLDPAADDEERRPDGLRAARGPDRRLRGRGLLERLPAGAGGARGRPSWSVKGRVDMKTDTAKLVAFEVHSFDEVPDIGIVRVAIDARTVPGDGARQPAPARARLPRRHAGGRRPRRPRAALAGCGSARTTACARSRSSSPRCARSSATRRSSDGRRSARRLARVVASRRPRRRPAAPGWSRPARGARGSAPPRRRPGRTPRPGRRRGRRSARAGRRPLSTARITTSGLRSSWSPSTAGEIR